MRSFPRSSLRLNGSYYSSLLFLLSSLIMMVSANMAPVLLPGHDLVNVSVSESASVGSIVHQLIAEDPEEEQITYTISGDAFKLDPLRPGLILVRERLDREKSAFVDVVVTVADDVNLVPFRRRIVVNDVNDNAPMFGKSLYRASVGEDARTGELVSDEITVTDADAGLNALIKVECDERRSGRDACTVFEINQRLSQFDNKVFVELRLAQELDHEVRTRYKLALKARDSSPDRPLSAMSEVIVDVLDVQDQRPIFLNSPYSATVEENLAKDSVLFDIRVQDGDRGDPRDLELLIRGDDANLFELRNVVMDEQKVLRADVVTAVDLDREHPALAATAGLYTFELEAIELPDKAVSTTTRVTVVVTDVDDSRPVFNRDNITVTLAEDVGQDTPLADLDLSVKDADVGSNAHFELVLENVHNSLGVFDVAPRRVSGSSPVIVRVVNTARIDFEMDDSRDFVFKINAVKDGLVLSSALVRVLVTDANDNGPLFESSSYSFEVREDAEPGTEIGLVSAQDLDSGSFGRITYSLNGFGASKFDLDAETGQLRVASCDPVTQSSCLDFETQNSFALTCTARDGGDRVATATIHIALIDVNDNYPIFDELHADQGYLRVVEEEALFLEPSLVVEASDADNDEIGYSIASINTEEDVFAIDENTGELTIINPVSSSHTIDGTYELLIRATDKGEPPLHRDVQVNVVVGSNRNRKPIINNENVYVDDNNNLNLRANVSEVAEIGTVVATISATDPDGDDDFLHFSIHSGSKDNFELDAKTGVLKVAQNADLDIERNGDLYAIQVELRDNGKPFSRTTKLTVNVAVQDINNKDPVFSQESYSAHVLETASVGESVLTVRAFDADSNAKLFFRTINDSISARDKTGNAITNRKAYDFGAAFAVDPSSGRVWVNSGLSHSAAAVIRFEVEVIDLNADEKIKPLQSSKAEVLIFIRASEAHLPRFASPWTANEPTISFDVDEQRPMEERIAQLVAFDPVKGETISKYEKNGETDVDDLVRVEEETGNVYSNVVLDYETMKKIEFGVFAVALDEDGVRRVSEAKVVINIRDVNDNPPIFEQLLYEVSLPESSPPLTSLLSVVASDEDSGDFGQVRYGIAGSTTENGTVHAPFIIDPVRGEIKVGVGADGRSLLDREQQAVHELTVWAEDNPGGGQKRNRVSTKVAVSLIDTNDSPPRFELGPTSTAVVPENAPIDTLVLTLTASDADLGENARISYSLLSHKDLFVVDENSGQVRTKTLLTGKGRKQPYIVSARAMDHGEPELFTDTEVYVTIGDVSSNDGVPSFTRPQDSMTETATITENAPEGTKVYEVKASDPDDPDTSNGKLVFSLLDNDPEVRLNFHIDPKSGIISTKRALDREQRDFYSLLVRVRDLGQPPQEASAQINVVVEDEDDNQPIFLHSSSMKTELIVDEEVALGTEIGRFEAHDADLDDRIDYAIVEGNDQDLFRVERTEDDKAILTVNKRIDRETSGESHQILLRCFKYEQENSMNRMHEKERGRGRRESDAELRVRINVRDIDDNLPVFQETHITQGVRINAARYSRVAEVLAVDADAGSDPIVYSIENITFHKSARDGSSESLDVSKSGLFHLESSSGVLETNHTLNGYNDGRFELVVSASNSELAKTFASIVVHVLQDTKLMRLVFDLPPARIQPRLLELRAALENELKLSPLSLAVMDDADFYSRKSAESLDFGRATTCFQLIDSKTQISAEPEDYELLNTNEALRQILKEHHVSGLESCEAVISTAHISYIEYLLLLTAFLLAILGLVAVLALCCASATFEREKRRNGAHVRVVEAPIRAYFHAASLPPGSTLGRPSSAANDWNHDTNSYHSLQRQ